MKYLIFPLLPIFLQAETLNFNRDVRPILSENCFYCHGVDGNKREADLRLDIRKDALASDAFVPGDLNASELFYRIHSEDKDEVMPPPESNRVLSAQQKRILYPDYGLQFVKALLHVPQIQWQSR